jgi:hypothetical protein
MESLYPWETMSSNPNILPPRTFNTADLPVVNPNGVEAVYANNASVFNGPHDLRIVFTEMVAEGVKAEPRQELRASVAMSYSQAQLLLQSLTQSLAMLKTAHKA